MTERQSDGAAYAMWTRVVLALGALLRIAFVREVVHTPPWYLNFLDGLDNYTHHQQSLRILADPWQSGQAFAFYQSPLYPYVLAGATRAFGPDPVVLAYFQAVLSALTAWLIARLARRIYGAKAGFVAALLASFSLQAVYYPIMFLPATLEMFCAALAMSAATHAVLEDRAGPWRWAGAAVALAFLARPNIAAATLVALAATAALTRPGLARLGIAAVAFAMGALLVLSPLLARNLSVARQVGLLPTSGSINFALGNSQDSLWAGFVYPKLPLIPLFSLEMLGFQLGKFFVFFWGYEVPQNDNMYLVREGSTLLSLPLVPLQVLVGLALTGALAGWRRREVRLPLVWLVAYALSISLFFIVGRFRLPAVPALCLLATVAVQELFRRVREGRWKSAALVAIPGAVAWLVSGQIPRPAVRFNDYSMAFDAGWSNMRPGMIEDVGRRAVRDYPGIVDFHAFHAATLVDLKRRDALAEIETTLQMDPKNPRAMIALLAYHLEVSHDHRAADAVRARIQAAGYAIPNEKAPPGR